MKNLKKAVALLLCAVLLVAASVVGTLAYLRSETEPVLNTFTIGDVQIKLDEAVVNAETGKAPDHDVRTETGNENVRLIPGRAADKDPTVTVLKDSENCYVQATVTFDVPEIEINSAQDAGNIVNNYIKYNDKFGFNNTNWEVEGPFINFMDENGNPNRHRFEYTLTYKGVVSKATADTKLPALFTHVELPGDITTEDYEKLEGMKISIVARAIQAEGFADADAAF